MPAELTWRQAIDKVLEASPDPMHYSDIAQRIIEEKLRKNFGATPKDTVNAQISTSMKREGNASPYIRVSRGIFTLRAKGFSAGGASSSVVGDAAAVAEVEEQYEIITSFGMYWRKDEVEWKKNPKLLGMQQIGATPVDFCNQIGIYLLYDGREVIYVGRAKERPLGQRLHEHTLDRLSGRWDRFSWFGLLPVSETGQIEAQPESYDASRLIPALEALLIEALEPRQNRKRGDDLASVEYIQKLDPAIAKKRVKDALDAAL